MREDGGGRRSIESDPACKERHMVAEIVGWEVLVVLIVVALLFGGPRLPKLARSLGSAKSEFEKGVREGAASTADSEPKDADKKDTEKTETPD